MKMEQLPTDNVIVSACTTTSVELEPAMKDEPTACMVINEADMLPVKLEGALRPMKVELVEVVTLSDVRLAGSPPALRMAVAPHSHDEPVSARILLAYCVCVWGGGVVPRHLPGKRWDCHRMLVSAIYQCMQHAFTNSISILLFVTY